MQKRSPRDLLPHAAHSSISSDGAQGSSTTPVLGAVPIRGVGGAILGVRRAPHCSQKTRLGLLCRPHSEQDTPEGGAEASATAGAGGSGSIVVGAAAWDDPGAFPASGARAAAFSPRRLPHSSQKESVQGFSCAHDGQIDGAGSVEGRGGMTDEGWIAGGSGDGWIAGGSGEAAGRRAAEGSGGATERRAAGGNGGATPGGRGDTEGAVAVTGRGAMGGATGVATGSGDPAAIGSAAGAEGAEITSAGGAPASARRPQVMQKRSVTGLMAPQPLHRVSNSVSSLGAAVDGLLGCSWGRRVPHSEQ